MRYSSDLIEKMKQMRRDGSTLSEIVLAVKIPKTSVFHHIRAIPKIQALVSRLSELSRTKQKKMADFRRGKSIKTYSYRKPAKWTADFVMLVAHLLFDGQFGYASCIYNNRSKALIDRFIRLMQTVIGVSDYKFSEKSDGVMRVSYHHVEIAAFMRRKADELLEYISRAPADHKIAFLRAFFDDEGSMCFEGKKRVVRGYQHSYDRLLLVQKLLRDFDIDGTIDKQHVEIKIGRRENLIKFQKLINFSEGVSINPARTNSIWKRDLQKRDILSMALASYRI